MATPQDGEVGGPTRWAHWTARRKRVAEVSILRGANPKLLIRLGKSFERLSFDKAFRVGPTLVSTRMNSIPAEAGRGTSARARGYCHGARLAAPFPLRGAAKSRPKQGAKQRGFPMKTPFTLLAAAGALAIAPSFALASAPGEGGRGMHGPPTTSSPSATGQGMHAPTTTSSPTTTTSSPTGNGGGYNHQNSPAHTTGQPNQSCETTGSPPGNAGSAPGSGFNEDGGKAGSKYAGEQPQNSRNTASVSQYDVACAKQPH